MTTRKQLFISSVQKELADDRRGLKEYVHGDPMLRRFFEVFLFEDLPASDRRSDEVYLHEVEQSAIYVGLFGNDYGYEDAEGISPTEREFDHATTRNKERLIFVKGNDDSARHPKMLALIRKSGEQLIRRRFGSISELTAILYASLIEHLERCGDIRSLPFDASACPRATIKDLSAEKIADFLDRAQRERAYPLGRKTAMSKALVHLNLLDKTQPSQPDSQPESKAQDEAQATGQVTGQVSPEVARLLLMLQGEMTRLELQQNLNLKGRANFEERYLKPALKEGHIEYTVPDKPNSRMQKYRLTAKGRTWLDSHLKGAN